MYFVGGIVICSAVTVLVRLMRFIHNNHGYQSSMEIPYDSRYIINT